MCYLCAVCFSVVMRRRCVKCLHTPFDTKVWIESVMRLQKITCRCLAVKWDREEMLASMFLLGWRISLLKRHMCNACVTRVFTSSAVSITFKLLSWDVSSHHRFSISSHLHISWRGQTNREIVMTHPERERRCSSSCWYLFSRRLTENCD